MFVQLFVQSKTSKTPKDPSGISAGSKGSVIMNQNHYLQHLPLFAQKKNFDTVTDKNEEKLNEEFIALQK